MTESETARVVAVLMAAFPHAKATAATSSAYESMLRDLEYAAVNAAISRLLATSRWMPTIAEIREATLSLQAGDVKPGGEAWGSVLKAIRFAGVHRVPGVDFAFADPVVAKCVRLLNWAELCNSENTTADRARFIELYDKLAKSHRVEQLSGTLPAVVKYRELAAGKAEEIARGNAEAVQKMLADVAKALSPDKEPEVTP